MGVGSGLNCQVYKKDSAPRVCVCVCVRARIKTFKYERTVGNAPCITAAAWQ